MTDSNATVIYFDHNATSPLLPEARQAWLEACEKFPGNPSSPHRVGARADNALGEAREKLARMLECHAAEIVFTSGATESNNAVLNHCANQHPEGELWISAIEHPCVLEPAHFHFGKRLRLIPATRDGLADAGWIDAQLKKTRPVLLALMAANNETGALQPWRDVLRLCCEHDVPLFCDAVQWLGKLPAAGFGQCHWVSGSAHKFGGPRGVGFLKVPGNLSVVPLLRGGPQEEGRRAGTENVAGVLAMVKALEHREKQIAAGEHHACDKLRHEFERRLAAALPESEIVAARAPRLWNTVSALMPEAGCQQRWVVKLDKLGFAVSTGSACSSGKEEPSHVLRAMGWTAAEAGRALRFSAGWETSREDWNALLSALQTIQPQAGFSGKKRPGMPRPG